MMPEIASIMYGFDSGVQYLDILHFLGQCPSPIFDDRNTQLESVFLIANCFASCVVSLLIMKLVKQFACTMSRSSHPERMLLNAKVALKISRDLTYPLVTNSDPRSYSVSCLVSQ
jgi:hypothetical protein